MLPNILNRKKIILVIITFGRFIVFSPTITLLKNFHPHDMVDHIILISFLKISSPHTLILQSWKFQKL